MSARNPMPAYVELEAMSNFSFLRGASHPAELVFAAQALGLSGLGLADRNSFAGLVRAHTAAKSAGLPFLPGVRLVPTDAPEILLYPTDRPAYARLSRLLTLGNRRAPKGECHLALADLAAHAEGQLAILPPPDDPSEDAAFAGEIARYGDLFPGRLWLAARHRALGGDRRRLDELAALAHGHRLPLIATNAVLYHSPDRRALQDVLTCIREHVTVDAAGFLLEANAERHLKAPAEMARLFADHPEALAETLRFAGRCTFSLDELAYDYPVEAGTAGRTPQQELEKLTWEGAARRYAEGMSEAVQAQLEHELGFIGELDYAPYFLTVHDIVRHARSQGILCQGRGSAANSAVCYALGITAVDPGKTDLLFERFISAERNEPPDIDVDFEHERREEVIQYIYGKYGRERAGIAATVITYRSRSAIREVGKALGLSADVIAALNGTTWGTAGAGPDTERVREAGLDPEEPRLKRALELAGELIGFPRHLSQHVGGFVITRSPLSELVPIANAAMADRTFIEWDKDDLDAVGMLKIDVLALGMLSCIRRAFDLLRAHYGLDYDLATLPAEDPATYDMICTADTVGVFQIESRAQMSMLPRLKPRDFYDLVIEVAIVRPGPIQGDMVHPYLRRRDGLERVEYPSEELRKVLSKTLGVPLFQEQAMKIAIVAAGFTPGEADRLRRAMATFRRNGDIRTLRDKFIDGMIERGYEPDFAERCFRQIEGFSDYGFPESHAASFALLVYVSAWLKKHYPDVFAAAILNSQPMGFYAPAQLVRDAAEHGVEIRPVDINHSEWDHTLEPARGRYHALRLGFRQIKGFAEADAARLVAAREAMPEGRFTHPREPWRKAGLEPAALERLARADGFGSLEMDRRAALWEIRALKDDPLPLFAAADAEAAEAGSEPAAALPHQSLGEHVVDDYASLRLTLKAHPLKLLRPDIARERYVPTGELAQIRDGTPVRTAGLVLVRQRPGSAKGVIFATLEDETGIANIIVWPKTFARFRREVMGARLLGVEGKLQREGMVVHVVADKLVDLSEKLVALIGRELPGEGLEIEYGPGDEVTHPGRDLRTVPPVRSHGHPRNARPVDVKGRNFH